MHFSEHKSWCHVKHSSNLSYPENVLHQSASYFRLHLHDVIKLEFLKTFIMNRIILINHLMNFQILEMDGNKLSRLGTDVFSSKNLIHLQEVSLTRCDIQRLNKFSLRNLTNLIKLNLADNQIRFIPGLAFSSVPELRY